MAKNVAAIICAAGPGTRFGGKRKKQFVDVAGRPVFLRSIELFSDRDDVKQILLGIAKEDEETLKVNWGAKLSFFHVKTFLGGKERFDTIRQGAGPARGRHRTGGRARRVPLLRDRAARDRHASPRPPRPGPPSPPPPSPPRSSR